MEPIASWSKDRVSDWLGGLDASLQQYHVSDWHLCGLDLLQLSSQDLENLGVTKIGHQEIILEAVEKLCSLTYGMAGESLQSLTEKLRAVAHTLQMGIQQRWRVNTREGATQLPANVLHAVLDLISSAKGLFSLLNRYQLSQSGNTQPASQSIISHCKELGATVQKDTTVYEKEKDIIAICRQLVAVCDDILCSCPNALLTHTAQLESVDLVPVSPGDNLGIEITSTPSSHHYVTGTVAESPADCCEKILAGDEVIKVNNQIVVGWSRANLVKKLQENPKGVTLVLKKVPGSTQRKNSKTLQTSTQREKEDEEDNPRHSIFERVAASVRSLSFRSAIQGPPHSQLVGQEEAELPGDTRSDNIVTSQLAASGGPEELDGEWLLPGSRTSSVSQRSPSPGALELGRASISSCPEMGMPKEDKETKKSSVKGMTTALSRRRVSCRELGSADCDGWLWKKRKENSVFLTQKWQRFWFVLKGPSLYWYNTPQEEKAQGLVQIASYNIESAGEHKRKNVFQMCHPRFQNFIFAAENVTDMSKWINNLIAAIQKHKKFHKIPPDSEEECYSETESEEEDTPSPRRRRKITTKPQPSTLPRTKAKKNKTTALPSPSKATGAPEDEMGVLFHRLKEGGVSLIGQDQPQTHDHFRKSFIRRNKNPVINEKAHTLRALQSTLKAKEAELQIINKVLEDSELTPAKFRQWKQINEHLSLEIEKLALQPRKASTAEDTPLATVFTGNDAPIATVSTGTDTLPDTSFSDGEQLVDAEPSVPLENVVSQALEPQEGMELSGSGFTDAQSSRDSAFSPDTARPSSENYFYI
ncbi:connector enhancer of kinase suppressor of ras 1 [Hypomesus transpacificus]|uniref:connector enhancer of kinase suppressor of ras 1 n=1 Tax=Hypomesus transpacificus TaxID=137520 RepID=UPI001F07748E|nr:connector enhancer of kinase suppressor of ras 1 [Hypomesus transpacificus]